MIEIITKLSYWKLLINLLVDKYVVVNDDIEL
jgi:hypothetical protein